MVSTEKYEHPFSAKTCRESKVSLLERDHVLDRTVDRLPGFDTALQRAQ